MTLEEAIKHCEEKSHGCDKCSDEHRQLTEWLKELKRLKEQPKGLDEAAEEYINGTTPEYGWTIENAFKAGAKWMTEQGLVKEQEVEDFGNGATIKAPKEKELDSIGATLGDKVIVQIRKA